MLNFMWLCHSLLNTSVRTQALDEDLDLGISQGLAQRRQRHPTPVLLPGESHGWRRLVVYSPWGR